MTSTSELRIEPAPEILSAAREWLAPVRAALGSDFLATYLTGSVLTQSFDPRRSRVNILVVAHALAMPALDRLRDAFPTSKRAPHFDPLVLTRRQIEHSLDVFAIELLDVKERHLRLEGDDVFKDLEIPATYLRLQLEHELRGKHIQLRQAYLLGAHHAPTLGRTLVGSASGFTALFRALLRLRGEAPPAEPARTITRVAELFGLDPEGLLAAHMLRVSGRRPPPTAELLAIYARFLTEVDRLVVAIDELKAT